MSSVLGLLLAAGAGRRMGTPKALLRDDDGTPFVVRAITTLRQGGCGEVMVVVGAAAEAVSALVVDQHVRVVAADDWDEGMGASLRAGLTAALDGDATCVLVTLVDLPDVGADVVRRMVERLDPDAWTLGRASYSGVPGHPVLLGRAHWEAIVAGARGDRGARDYLAANPPTLVECGDLATGRDVDTREAL